MSKRLLIGIMTSVGIMTVAFFAQSQTYTQTYTAPPTQTPPVTMPVPTSTPPVVTGPAPILEKQPLVIDETLIKDAGFTDVRAQAPEDARFDPSTHYFHVHETVAGAPGAAWGDAANLVAVYVLRVWREDVQVTKEPEETDLNGRTQVRDSKPGYYIVVTGSNADDVRALVGKIKTDL